MKSSWVSVLNDWTHQGDVQSITHNFNYICYWKTSCLLHLQVHQHVWTRPCGCFTSVFPSSSSSPSCWGWVQPWDVSRIWTQDLPLVSDLWSLCLHPDDGCFWDQNLDGAALRRAVHHFVFNISCLWSSPMWSVNAARRKWRQTREVSCYCSPPPKWKNTLKQT